LNLITRYKYLLRLLWLSLVIIGFVFYLSYPEFFTKEIFVNWLGNNHTVISTMYLILICLRALFFIPSTIVLLLGIALYPQDPFYVISINLFGILLGAYLLYSAANFLTPEKLFPVKKQERFEVIKSKMRKQGFWIVLVWSFIPIVPTDLICFVAGVVKMNRAKFYAAVFLGEIVLISIYVYTGKGMLQLIN
jgi:uncharacterized membrane protein YdjX (TVP38/TMEM64 family)